MRLARGPCGGESVVHSAVVGVGSVVDGGREKGRAEQPGRRSSARFCLSKSELTSVRPHWRPETARMGSCRRNASAGRESRVSEQQAAAQERERIGCAPKVCCSLSPGGSGRKTTEPADAQLSGRKRGKKNGQLTRLKQPADATLESAVEGLGPVVVDS